MKRFGFLLIAFLITGGTAAGVGHSAWAATDFSAISNNMVTSVEDTPGLISGLSYLLGLVLGVMGILRLKQHVEDPRSHQMKDAVVRFAAGGALFALPTIYEVALNTIGGSSMADGIDITGSIQSAGADSMAVSDAGTTGVNEIFQNIVTSMQDTPGLVTSIGYLLGLVFGVNGILKLKDHVGSPDNVPLREGVTRLLAAGSLFALATIFEAIWHTITGSSDGNFGMLETLAQNMSVSNEKGQACSAVSASSVGGVICSLYTSSSMFPLFIKAAAYLMGTVMGIWGVLKIKEHILNPQQAHLWDGAIRLIVGGALFALPYIIEAVMESMTKGGNHTNTGSSDGGASTSSSSSSAGLDTMMSSFIANIFGPTDIIMTFFGYAAGALLVMIGIMRLLKATHEGARGPGGIGTIMTFIAGGALLSFSPMVAAFSVSLFSTSTTVITPALQYTAGLEADETAHIVAVISAITKFVLLLGLVSFLRGIFIVRGVAEGNQQASMMSGMTHIIGGALAVNLGPFINVLESTLGLSQYGVTFQ